MIQIYTFYGGDSHPKQACLNAMRTANDFLATYGIQRIISQTTNFSSLISEGGNHWNDCIITITLDVPSALETETIEEEEEEKEEIDPRRDEITESLGDLDEHPY